MSDGAWDAIVIGAGLAGASAAIALCRSLVERGRIGRVLLVERSAWPRAKVCGCCLHAGAVAVLEQLGTRSSAALARARAGGARIERVRIGTRGRWATIAHGGGVAIGRRELDGALVEDAMCAGVEFLPERSARVLGREGERWRVEIGPPGCRRVDEAPLVIVADGVGGTSLAGLGGFEPRLQPGGWIGFGCLVDGDADDLGMSMIEGVEAGSILMHVGGRGYVGLVRLDARRVALAGAADPVWVREVGGPGPASARVMEEARAIDSVVARALASGRWAMAGTSRLTRGRRVAADGLLVAGDAAAYVEPITGEGMGWAVASGVRAGELASDVVAGVRSAAGAAEDWERWHRGALGPRRRVCAAARWMVHRPWVARRAIWLLSATVAGPMIGAGLSRAARSLGAARPGREQDDGRGSGRDGSDPGHRARDAAASAEPG